MQHVTYGRRRFLTLVGACAALLSTRCVGYIPPGGAIAVSSAPISTATSTLMPTATSTPTETSTPTPPPTPTLIPTPTPTPKPIARAADYVKVHEKWTADHLYDFLNALPDEELLKVKKSLALVDQNAGVDALNRKSKDVREIQEEALWVSSSIFTYPFRDETALDYHGLVTWAAEKLGIDQSFIDKASTFFIERDICKKFFEGMWDELTVEQREELFQKIDPSGKIKDRAALAGLGGSAVVATLSTTVYFSGFAFYVAMSTTISYVAGLASLTLPFAAYTGASTLVALVSGPIGWAIIGTVAVGSSAWLGKADVKKTISFINSIHALKIEALNAAGVSEEEVFNE